MRLIVTILIVSLLACSQSEIRDQENKVLIGYWVSKNLVQYAIDSTFDGGQTMYGSGYLLKLDSNGRVTSVGADFYWLNDSLYLGGEPGMTLKTGTWQHKDQFLVLTQKLISKTFMLTSEQIGQSDIDSIIVLNDSSIIHRPDTLVFVKQPAKDLELFIQNINCRP